MSLPVNIVGGGPEMKEAFVSPASIADNQIVAAVAGKRLRLVAAFFDASGGANTATFKSAANAKSGALALPATTVYSLSFNPVGWLHTNKGEALNLALTAATAVAINVVYQEVD